MWHKRQRNRMWYGALAALAAVLPLSAAAELAGVEIVNVTPSEFTVIWEGPPAGSPEVHLYQDEAATVPVEGPLGREPFPVLTGDPDAPDAYEARADRRAIAEAMRTKGVYAVRVTGATPGTLYYLRVETHSVDGNSLIWPESTPLPGVATATEAALLAESRQLLVSLPEEWETSGAAVVLTAEGAAYPIAALFGDGALPNEAYVNLSDLIDPETGAHLEPGGTVAATLQYRGVEEIGSSAATLLYTGDFLVAQASDYSIEELPIIVEDPQSQSVEAGETVMFEVEASGDDLSFQWHKDGEVIDGATEAVLAIENVTAEDAGDYAVLIANPAGEIESAAATLALLEPPVIVEHPESVEAAIGDAVSFSVVAEGADLSYQWFKNGEPIEGEAGSVFGIGSVAAEDEGAYTVVAVNPIASVESGPAQLIIVADPAPTPDLEPPEILVHPEHQTALVGESVTFEVEATGLDLSFQWRLNGDAIEGATNPAFTIASVTEEDSGDYTVVVSNPAGSVESETAVLNVTVATPTPEPPEIVVHPEDQAVFAGESVTFTVEAVGIDLSFQWQRNVEPVDGATGPAFTIESATVDDAGEYSVVVSNMAGSVVSDTATLEVHGPPEIVEDPLSIEAMEGDSVTLMVDATGEDLSFQWHRDGDPIQGATSDSLVIESVATGDAGSYTVVISNLAGTIEPDAAILTVIVPTPTPTPEPTPAPVASGPLSDAVFLGDGLYESEWFGRFHAREAFGSWIFSEEKGWVYVFPAAVVGGRGMWMWDYFLGGYTYTEQGIYGANYAWVFSTELGWIALDRAGSTLCERLYFDRSTGDWFTLFDPDCD